MHGCSCVILKPHSETAVAQIDSLPIHLNQGVSRHQDLPPVLPHESTNDGPTPIGHVPELHTLIWVFRVNDLNLVTPTDVHITPNKGHIGHIILSRDVDVFHIGNNSGHAHSPVMVHR